MVIVQEVDRLPEKYRAPFVLCHLESRSNREAARELGCALGTIESRLTRARQRLRDRLTRRGIAPALALLAVDLSRNVSSASVPGSLVMTTVRTVAKGWTGQAVAGLSANAATLAEAVIKSMWMSKIRVAGTVLGVCFIFSSAGFLLNRSIAEPQDGVAKAKPSPVATASQASETKIKGVPDDQKLESASGYAWAIAPRTCPSGAAWAVGWSEPPAPGLPTLGGISAFEGRAKDGGLEIILACPPGNMAYALDYRPVAFDANNRRYLLAKDGGVGTATADLARFHLDPKLLPVDEIKFIGIEALSVVRLRLFAKLAAAKARKAGIEVLPFTQVGQAYKFVLTATDGRTISSGDLRGKVVLINCWATWCVPSMELLPDVKKLYEKYHAEGLDVVGVNLDTDDWRAQTTFKSVDLPWPGVLVPADEEKRDLWFKASGIGALPRVLLLDREGILRADQPARLEAQVAKLLKGSGEK